MGPGFTAFRGRPASESNSRDINRELVAASTRDDIERAVCDRLTGADLFDVAWVAGRTLAHGSVSPRSWTDTDAATLDGHIETLCATAPTPVDEALDAHDPVFTSIDPGMPGESHASTAVVVPLAYRGAEYGVLVVETSDPNAFDLIEREIFAELGWTIADAISAVEGKQILASDSVAELEFQLRGLDEPLTGLAAQLDCTVDLEHIATDVTESTSSVKTGSY